MVMFHDLILLIPYMLRDASLLIHKLKPMYDSLKRVFMEIDYSTAAGMLIYLRFMIPSHIKLCHDEIKRKITNTKPYSHDHAYDRKIYATGFKKSTHNTKK